MNRFQEDRIRRAAVNRQCFYGKEPSTVQEVFDCILAVCVGKLKHFDPDTTIHGLVWKVDYSSTVSNTHYCPLSGTTNWAGRALDAPRGYPGFQGRVWIRFDKQPRDASGTCKAGLLHTGSGGGGAYDGGWAGISGRIYNMTSKLLETQFTDQMIPKYTRIEEAREYLGIPELHLYSWDARFFLDDFPALQAEIDAQHCAEKLSDQVLSRYTSSLRWTHDDALKIDDDINDKHKRMFSGEYI